MNAINTYGYTVYKGIAPFPLHIVAIYSEKHIGFSVFDNSRDARAYILDNCKDVKYSYDFDFYSDFGDLLKLYTTTDKKYFFKGTNNQLYIHHKNK